MPRRIHLTKTNGERVRVDPDRVAHYHEFGEACKVHMDDKWVYATNATIDELDLLIDPPKVEAA